MLRILGRGSGLLGVWWRSDLYSVCERAFSRAEGRWGMCGGLVGFFVYMMDGCMIHCRYVD